MAIRYDRGNISKVTETPQGGIRVTAAVARTGILEYRNPDGSTRRELRRPEQVFHTDSMASLEGAPVTDLHPPELVTPKNYRKYAAGHVAEGTVRRDGDVLVADLVIQAGDLAGAVLEGQRKDISCGYRLDLDETPGIWEGQPYDAEQVNVRQNHVAICPPGWGRSGASVSLRLDSAGDGLPPAPAEEVDQMEKFERIDGVDYAVGTPPHEAACKRRDVAEATRKAEHDAMASKLAQAEARADAAEAQAKDAAQRAAASVKLQRQADKHGVAVREDMNDDEVRKLVIAKAHPGLDLTDKDPAYLAAAFDLALDTLATKGAAGVRGDGGQAPTGEKTPLMLARERADAATKAAHEAGRTAWRQN